MTPDSCVYCGADAIRDNGGTITGWAVQWGYGGAGQHEHETIGGER